MSKFKEISDKWKKVDQQAIDDFREDHCWSPPSLETQISFSEYRRSLVAAVVSSILEELIARDEAAHPQGEVES